jgi:hypothetical protein
MQQLSEHASAATTYKALCQTVLLLLCVYALARERVNRAVA